MPTLSGRITFKSVKRRLPAGATLVIGIDTEYQAGTDEEIELPDDQPDNWVLCYTFSVADPDDFENRISGIIFTSGKTRKHRPEFNGFLARVIQYATDAGLIDGPPGRVLACCHFSRADLPGFRDFKKLKRSIDAVRRTYATITRPTKRNLYTITGRPFFVMVRLFDTMLLAPGGYQSLAALGELLQFPKIDLPPGTIQNMSQLLADDPILFEEYAVRDAEVSAAWLIKVLELFKDDLGLEVGANPPATLGAAGVAKFRADCQISGLPLDNLLGIEKVPTMINGRRNTKRQKIAAYCDRESFYADCYHGGRNEAYFHGFTPEGDITDIDIKGAYTTAMAAIRMPDWDQTIDTADLGILADLGAEGMGFARVKFEFPLEALYPCLPVRAGDAGLMFPRKGISCATGPELHVAQRLGAAITVERGVYVPWLDCRRPFLEFTMNIVSFRNGYKNKSAPERTAKEIGNALYGKVAQGVAQMRPADPQYGGSHGKRVFDIRKGEMTTLPPSAITNAALAAFTTGLVRGVLAELIASVPSDKAVYSATTDGLLTTATQSDLAASGPVSAFFATLRQDVDGDPSILEIKGRVGQVVIPKTRGTFTSKALGATEDSDPIIAKAGQKLEDPPIPNPTDDTPKAMEVARRAARWQETLRWCDIYKNRHYDLRHHHRVRIDLRTQWLSDSDLIDVERNSRVNLDYDMKRRPGNITSREGVLAFSTSPWETIDDFLAARDALEQWKRSTNSVLRTEEDYSNYEAWAKSRPVKTAAKTRGGRSPLITTILRSWMHRELGLPGPAGKGRSGGERIIDLANAMTDAGWPTKRSTIDNARKKEPEYGVFEEFSPEEIEFLKWALRRWPGSNFSPLAAPNTAAAEVIVAETACVQVDQKLRACGAG